MGYQRESKAEEILALISKQFAQPLVKKQENNNETKTKKTFFPSIFLLKISL